MDIGLKIAIGAGVSLATAGLIINPNGKQKEAAALNMFDKCAFRLRACACMGARDACLTLHP